MDKEFDIDQITKQSRKQNAEGLENETSIGEKSFAEERLEGLKQDRAERKKYAKWTFVFLCIFTIIILSIIILAGFGNICGFSFNLLGLVPTFTFSFKPCPENTKTFHLSDSVLITLITTSLSTIVGIFILVMRYLFNKNKA